MLALPVRHLRLPLPLWRPLTVDGVVSFFDGWRVIDSGSAVSIMGRWLYAVLDGQRVDVAYCVVFFVSHREFFFRIGEDRFGGAPSGERQTILMDTGNAKHATWPWLAGSWRRMERPSHAAAP